MMNNQMLERGTEAKMSVLKEYIVS